VFAVGALLVLVLAMTCSGAPVIMSVKSSRL
jgi:hypothetical protein